MKKISKKQSNLPECVCSPPGCEFHDLYEKIIESSKDFIFVVDKNFLVRYLNAFAAGATPFPRKKVIGRKLDDIFPPDICARMKKNIRRVIAAGKMMFFEENLIVPTGKKMSINTQLFPLKDGEVRAVVGVSRDTTEHNAAISDLQKTKNFYENILNSMIDGVDIVGRDCTIQFINKVFLDTFGESAIGKKCYEIYKIDKKQCLGCPLKKEMKIGETKIIEVPGIVGGKTFVVTHTRLDTPDGTYRVLETFRDITESVKSKEKLKFSEYRFRNLFDYMDESVAIYEVRNGGKDVIIKDFNKAAEKLEKVKKEDIVGKKVDDVFKGVKRFGLYDIFVKVWKTGRPIRHAISFYEDKYRHGWRDNFVFKLPSGEIVAVYSDITEKKILEEKLKESEHKYSGIVEGGNDGIVIIQDKIVKFVNRTMEKMLGYKKGEAIGKPFIDYVASHWKMMVMGIYLKRLLGKKVPNRYEFGLLKKNNGYTPVETNSSIIKYDGRPAVMAIIRDMSRWKELDRLKSEFLSMASHQLRTPLTAIKWAADVFLKNNDNKLKKDDRAFLEQIFESNERMIKLVNDVISVSKIEAGQKIVNVRKNSNVCEIIKNVIAELIRQATEKKIKILSRLCECPKLLVDPDKIFIVFENILNNAIKYSPEKSTVNIGYERNKNNYIFCIKDRGAGIPKSQQKKVFEKFFRGQNISSAEAGTGLGLYIAKAIVEAHGGKIWFKSKLNKGTTFYISLPLK
jgi:PAS domain S-box-containing protein